ncbi:PAS domain-containing protein [Bradyrhizobium sp. 190]|uniref:PAS domain-containing protein n=1 Tax=Bradyrhizobium sp. 190 TaxID=2782658 RepID=UPI001FF73334|nr:PAS domain-containing protein [Bradyrhizobium sp. 190]MCK1513245.1 PAS domain-containing protein [Bradyrhizobium sp. 190]
MLPKPRQFLSPTRRPGVNSRTVVTKVAEQFIDHLRFLEQNLHIGLCRVDLSDKRMVWSDGIYDLFDHDRNVQPSRDAFHQRMHLADRRDRELVNVALQRRTSFDDKFRIILRDRRIRWMRARGEFLFNENGHPDVLLVLMADITAEQTHRDLLHTKTKHLEAVAKLSGATVTTAAPSGRVTNVIYRQPFSKDAKMLGTRWIEWAQPEDRAELLNRWRENSQRGEEFESDVRVCFPDGSRSWRKAKAAPIRSLEGEIVEWLALSFDIDDDRTSRTLLDLDRPATGAQFRAARGLLRISVQRLSELTGVSIAVIRRLEELDGVCMNGIEERRRLRAELEKQGVAFLFPRGLKPTVTLR